MKTRTLTVLFLALIGCGSTAQEEVRYPVYAAGTAKTSEVFGDWTLTLTEAEIALGPIYFCATQSASADLCETAVQEFASSARVNALDSAPQDIGTIYGVSAEIRSATYDYGIGWLTTQANPTATAGSVDGQSIHMMGHIARQTEVHSFDVVLALQPPFAGAHVVQGQPIAAGVYTDAHKLEIHIDPYAWWSNVDFESLILASTQGSVTLTEQARNALSQALVLNAAPTFQWTER